MKLTGEEGREEKERTQLHIDRFRSRRFDSRSWYESSHFPTDTLLQKRALYDEHIRLAVHLPLYLFSHESVRGIRFVQIFL